mmetsp:Transcript_25589/g.22734  ORF Transcript_25589/g.22734 Transcript_25589/m.22734 type:complete len:140 (+) Transcript_25589:797-1216(+)
MDKLLKTEKNIISRDVRNHTAMPFKRKNMNRTFEHKKVSLTSNCARKEKDMFKFNRVNKFLSSRNSPQKMGLLTKRPNGGHSRIRRPKIKNKAVNFNLQPFSTTFNQTFDYGCINKHTTSLYESKRSYAQKGARQRLLQ